MANELTRLAPLPTGLSPQQRQRKALQVLAKSTTSTFDATRAAKLLCGQWPHLKADNPETYIATIAAVLSQFPPEIVGECCDPRIGLAKFREFPPTAAAVDEWCARRETWYRKWAAYVPTPTTPVWIDDSHKVGPVEKTRRAGFLEAWRGILRGLGAK